MAIKVKKPTKKIKPEPAEQPKIEAQEYERIVEFSFNPKTSSYVVRFLSGEGYALAIEDLPGKLQIKSPDWKSVRLNPSGTGLLVGVGKRKLAEIPSHLVHSRGKLIR